MISAPQNELMTRVGAETPGGRLLRRYWQPVALLDELHPARPAKAVRLLGEDFVVFRDHAGRYGLIDRACPHRGADLAYGRLEDGGIRCAFHGWLFDVEGRCLETPAEPARSRMCEHIRQRAFPVVERSGILFAYLGAAPAPELPAFDCFIAPSEFTFAFKGYLDCNWLQALEVGIDPAHASYLHRFFEDEDPSSSYGKQFRAATADSTMPITKVLREHARPEIGIEKTQYGMRLTALRRIDDQRTHVRVTNLVFPQAFVIPMSPDITISQWHVPIDDYSCYWYAIFTSFDQRIDKQTMRDQRLQLYELPDYKPRVHRGNHWGFDVHQQKSQTYTGMGFDINVHDQWAVESQGRIQDRTRENLGSTDKGISLYRRMLVDAIQANAAGKNPPLILDSQAAKAVTGPIAVDGIAPGPALAQYGERLDAQRRERCEWARPTAA